MKQTAYLVIKPVTPGIRDHQEKKIWLVWSNSTTWKPHRKALVEAGAVVMRMSKSWLATAKAGNIERVEW